MERREKRVTERDLVGHLLNFRDENGENLSEDQIADNIIGVLFAAQDTTATVLTWILKYLHDNFKLFEAVKVTIFLHFHSNHFKMRIYFHNKGYNFDSITTTDCYFESLRLNHYQLAFGQNHVCSF